MTFHQACLRFSTTLALCAATALAHAERVDLTFTGVIEMTALSSLPPGTTVTGRLSYDSSPEVTDVFGQSLYYWTQPTAFEVTYQYASGPSRQYVADALGAAIFRGEGQESIQFQSIGLTRDGQPYEDARLVLGFVNDPMDTPVLAGGFPTSFNLADFDFASGMLLLGDRVEPLWAFRVTSISAVPEPSSALMASVGVLLLAGNAARTRRRSQA